VLIEFYSTYGDYYFTPWGFFLTLLGTILAALKTIYTNVLQASSQPRLRPSATNPTPSYKYTKISPAPRSLSTTFHPPQLPCLSPLQLLHLLSPLAFIETMLIAYFSGELASVREYAIAWLRHSATSAFPLGQPPLQPGLSTTQLWLLLVNGAMAFGLNVVSFTANKKVGALSMTVAGEFVSRLHGRMANGVFVANVKQVLTISCAVALFNITITPTNAVGIVLTLIGGAIYTAVELKERSERLGGYQ
jgi:hypothetical protein